MRRRRHTDGARILIVEDSAELRLLMEIALAEEGYDIESTDSAEGGVRLMERKRYDLVLTDYMLPRHNGGWLLREALRRNLLHGAVTLLVTAEAHPPGIPDGQDVVTKPVDFERFLPQIRTMLSRRPAGPRLEDEGGMRPHVELVLYVSPASFPSRAAVRELRGILKQYDAGRVSLHIADVSHEISEAARDHVIFTPTLVKRTPGPPVWVVGDLTHAEVIHDLLQLCGLDRVTPSRA